MCMCVYEGLYVSYPIYSLLFTFHLNVDVLKVKLSLILVLLCRNLLKVL